MNDEEKKQKLRLEFLEAVEEKKKWLEENPDMNTWKGAHFSFYIQRADKGFDPDEINFDNYDFDEVMTPNSFEVNKVRKDDWDYYQVGDDEFCYSLEPPGYLMEFNDEITFVKAKQIADEIITNLEQCMGYQIQLEINY